MFPIKIVNKYIVLMIIAASILSAFTVIFAETKVFEKEYTYQASELDSKVSSRSIALEQVKRLLLEELGTYLVSETEVKNLHLSKDKVTGASLSAGCTRRPPGGIPR